MKKTIIFAVVFVLILGLATNPVSAKEIITWEHISESMDGGIIQALAINPSNSSILYAGTPVGVYKSVDGGENWFEINEGLSGFDVISIEINPLAPDIIYIVSSGVVYKSENGGQQWITISYSINSSELGCIAINPIDPSILLVGAKQGFYRSIDAGNTWSFIPVNDQDGLFFFSVVFDPINPENVYAGTTFSYFYKSTDGGDTWVMKMDVSYDRVKTIIVLNQHPQIVYFASNRGVYKSVDAGETFDRFFGGVGILTFAIHPNNPLIMYVSTSLLLYKSKDGGMNWEVVENWANKIDRGPNVVIFDFQNPDIIYAGTRGSGLFKTIDNGENWEASYKGIHANDITGIAQSTQYSNVFYASAYLGGVFKSIDNGASWVSLGKVMNDSELTGIGVHPNNPNIVLAGDRMGYLSKSEDGGLTWTNVFNVPLQGGKFTFLFVPDNPDIIYAGNAQDIIKSVDGGDTWMWVRELSFWGKFINDIAINPLDTNTVYFVSRYSLTKTEDGGETWKDLVTTHTYSYRAVALYEANPEILFLAGNNGISKSVDGGESYSNWSDFNTGLPTLNITTLYLDSENGLIYAGTYNHGIYVSNIETANWSPANIGLKSMRVNLLVGDKSVASTVYAGTKGGVFRSSKIDLNHQLYLPLTIK